MESMHYLNSFRLKKIFINKYVIIYYFIKKIYFLRLLENTL